MLLGRTFALHPGILMNIGELPGEQEKMLGGGGGGLGGGGGGGGDRGGGEGRTVTRGGLASHSGGVAILIVALYNRNRNKPR